MARLLGELAALPPDQRQAIAKLLNPAEVTTAKLTGTILDERCALDDRKALD